MKDSYLTKYQKIAGDGNSDITLDPPVFSPENENELCELVRAVHSDKYKIRITGSGTYPVPESGIDTVTLSTASLSKILEINADDYLITVQAGAVVDKAVHESEQSGLYLPLDITSGGRSTIGGAYMTEAHSPGSAGHGSFGESVIGARCVTAQGETVTFGGRTAKNVTGYDLTRFLSGTLGMFAIVSELIIKAHTLPEMRRMAVADFSVLSNILAVVRSKGSVFDHAARAELTAPSGTGGEIMLGVGFEGFRAMVKENVNRAGNGMNDAGAEAVHSQGFKQYMNVRKKAAEKIVGPGLYTITVPPASSGIFLEKIHFISPEMPVIAHLKTGRFHVKCLDIKQLAGLTESSAAIGGKHPREWNYLQTKGLTSVLTDAERSVVKSLKEDMDPAGTFNPHICAW
jgi:FAD/FMN-containing dehydrogenase